jgi:hypothetical protein
MNNNRNRYFNTDTNYNRDRDRDNDRYRYRNNDNKSNSIQFNNNWQVNPETSNKDFIQLDNNKQVDPKILEIDSKNSNIKLLESTIDVLYKYNDELVTERNILKLEINELKKKYDTILDAVKYMNGYSNKILRDIK